MTQALAEKLEYAGPLENERVASMPQSEQLASTPAPPLSKGKETEPSVQITRLCKVCESFTLVREKGLEQEHGKKRMDSTVKESRFQGGEEGKARRTAKER